MSAVEDISCVTEAVERSGSPRRLAPHCITDLDELHAVVEEVQKRDAFCIDIETNGLHHRKNDVIWVGLATYGGTWMIPMGHPHGNLITPEHSIDVADMTTVRAYKNDPTRFTKPKTHKERVEATFAPAPKQLRPDQVFKAIEPLVFGDQYKVGHNVQFDLLSIAKYYGDRIPPGPIEDTIVLQHTLNENLIDYKLKGLICKWLLGLAAQKKEVREAFYPNFGDKIMVSGYDDIARYLAKDCTFDWIFWKTLRRQLDDNLARVYDIDMTLYEVLADMSFAGVYVNRPLLVERGEVLAAEIRELEIEAWRICGMEFKLTNDAFKRDFLFGPKKSGGQGLKPTKFTPTGLISVDAETMSRLGDQLDDDGNVVKKGNRLATILRDFAEKNKLMSTYITPFTEGGEIVDGRIHCRFNQHRVETGRLSSSDPNLQNIPIRSGGLIRECFSAPPGCLLVCADYDQVELRVMAFLSKDRNMRRLFETGEDIHAAAAAAMYGIDPADVSHDQRAKGKTTNFLVGYGGTEYLLAAKTGASVETAKKFIDNYYKQFPALLPWKARVIEKALKLGDRTDPIRHPPIVMIPPFNRYRRIPELFTRPHDKDSMKELSSAQRQAVNAVVQGMASYIMKVGMINIYTALAAEYPEAQMVLTVHDEVMTETPERDAEGVMEVVVREMSGVQFEGAPILGPVPLIVSAKIADNWYAGK